MFGWLEYLKLLPEDTFRLTLPDVNNR